VDVTIAATLARPRRSRNLRMGAAAREAALSRLGWATWPEVSWEEIVAAIAHRLGEHRRLRVPRRRLVRIPEGGTGSHFERVPIDVDG
jgi:hypothetical protein